MPRRPRRDSFTYALEGLNDVKCLEWIEWVTGVLLH